MRLFVLRLLAVGILVLLYQLNHLAGVAALGTGFAYVIVQRTRTWRQERRHGA